MIVRPARAEDAARIAALEGDLSPAQVAETLALPTTVALVAEADGHLVGHVLASAVADEGEILWITVDPLRRRGGTAQRLLAAVDDVWKTRGVTQAWLEVRPDNAAARALYLGLGWAEHGVRRAYYRDGSDALRMRKARLATTP